MAKQRIIDILKDGQVGQVVTAYGWVRSKRDSKAVTFLVIGDGSQPVGSSPEEFRRFMQADLDKWAKLVKESGAKLD